MLRENLFETKNNMGVNIRASDNERSYVITPLLHAKAIKVETKLEDVLKIGESLGFGSTRYVDNNAMRESAESSSIQ